MPLAAALALFCVFTIEVALRASPVWYADEAAWYWRTKTEMGTRGALDGEGLLLGSSVTFHGLDPVQMGAAGLNRQTVNLALNGMNFQHEAQWLQRYLARPTGARWLVLEFRNLIVERDSWVRGPYWQFWATSAEFRGSGIPAVNPGMLVPFAANRVFYSFAFRAGIDNWISDSVPARRVSITVRDRNRRIARDLATYRGFVPAFDTALPADTTLDAGPRPWQSDAAGRLWAGRILAACQAHDIEVFLWRPPVPTAVAEAQARSGYERGVQSSLAGLRSEFPGLRLDTFSPGSYDVTMFADDHHLSPAGVARASRELAEWLVPRLSRKG